MDDVTRPKPTATPPAVKPAEPASDGHFSIPVTRRPIEGSPVGASSPSRPVNDIASPAASTIPMSAPQPPVDNSPKTLDELDAPDVTVDAPSPEAEGAPDLPGAPVPEETSAVADPVSQELPSEPTAPESPEPATPPADTFAAPTPILEEKPKEKGPLGDIQLEENGTTDFSAPADSNDGKKEGSVIAASTGSAPRKGNMAAIVVAVLIALGLVAGAGYAYWQNNKDKKAAEKPATQATQQEKVKNPATSEDVDKATADIDAALKKVDDSKDFQESDLSDATLGL